MSQKQHIIDYTNDVNKLTPIIKEQLDLLTKFAETHKKAYALIPSDVIKQQKEQIELDKESEKLQQESLKTRKLVEDAEKRRVKTLRDAEIQERKNLKLNNDFVNAMDRQKKAQDKLNTAVQQAERPYIQLQRRWREAQATLADLTVSQGKNAQATKQAQAEFNKLDKQIKVVDATTKNYSKNVGNYSSAIGGNISKIMGAFGIVGGLTMGVAVIKDAFSILREYEAEVVNLGAIAGKSRSELTSLEAVIRNTAKTSLNTATDVAKIATELIKLGSSTEEAERLIPTVNNLSIALRSTADETAELLKSTLNAFGEGADQAKRYGDVIAGMANKTALDFGRIRDAMSYIAPVAKTLGYSLEETGALIGVLVDNGIKAESAGRLLRTAMIKLQGQGLTLNQALEAINKSTDKTTTAYNLMGAEASTLGVVLASNIGKLKELSTELGNTGGELDKLTKMQLESMDAKVKILNSTWDEFILSINGSDNAIGNWVNTALDGLTALIGGITRASTSWRELAKQAGTNSSTSGYESAMGNFVDYDKYENQRNRAEIEQNNLNQKKASLLKQIKDAENVLRRVENDQLVPAILGGTLFDNSIKNAGLKLEELNKELGDTEGRLKAIKELDSSFKTGGKKTDSNSSNATQELSKAEKKARDKAITDAKKAEEDRLKLVFEINKKGLESEIEHNRNVSLAKAKNYEQELGAEQQYLNDRKKIVELNYQEEKRLAGTNDTMLKMAFTTKNIELLKIEDENQKILNKARDESLKITEKLLDMQEDNELKNSLREGMLLAKNDNERLKVKLKNIEDERTLLEQRNRQAIESEKYSTEQKLVINEEYEQKLRELRFETDELNKESLERQLDKTKDYFSKYTDLGNFGFGSLNFFTEIEENGKTALENLFDNTEDWGEKAAKIFIALGDVAKDVFNAINAGSEARFQNEMARIQSEYDTNILFAGESATAKAEIDRQFEEKKTELQRKRAKKEKQAAIFGAVINTAQGIVAALANPGGPAGIVLAGLVGVLGAVQIASIANTPLPEYWTGTDSAKEGYAWTQERGAEVITDKKGNVKTFGNNRGAQITWMDQGDKVYKSQEDYFNRELNGILMGNNIAPIMNINSGATAEEIDRIFAKHIASQSKVSVSVDEKGIHKSIAKGNNRKNIMSNEFKI